MNILSKIVERIAMEFPTEEALKKYLEDHPDADKSLHHVVKTEKPVQQEQSEKHTVSVEHLFKGKELLFDKFRKEVQKQSSSEGLTKYDIEDRQFYIHEIRQKILSDLFKENPKIEAVVTKTKKILSDFNNNGYNGCAANLLSKAVMMINGQSEPDYKQTKYKCNDGSNNAVNMSFDEWNQRQNKSNPYKTPIEEIVEGLRCLAQVEQELLRKAGLVDENDCIEVYRGVIDEEQNLVEGGMEQGDKVTLRGNYMDSWSLSPRRAANFATNTANGYVIKAKMPIKHVLTSFLGNGDYKYNEEKEVACYSRDIQGEICVARPHYVSEIDWGHYKEDYQEYTKKVAFGEFLKPSQDFYGKKLDQMKDVQEPTDKDLEKIKEVLEKEGKEIPSKDKLIVIFKSMIKDKQ